MYSYSYETDIGKITITEAGGYITNLYFQNDVLPEDLDFRETPVLCEAARQLELYLKGELCEFNLPLKPEGTPFMKKVWNSLIEIPYGSTCSYKAIAERINSSKACRAVGLANNRNPIPVFIPCHRVIGINGSLTGYRGGLELKSRLLNLEQLKT